MSSKILAVHLSPRRLCTAVAESTIGTFRVTSLGDAQAGTDEEIAAKLGAGEWDRVVASLPADRALFRFLTLPFSERRRVAQAVGPALEEHVPLSLDEAKVAWDFAAADPGNIAPVLAAMAPRADVTRQLDRLSRAGLTPSKLIWEPVATAEVYRRAIDDPTGFTAIDIGPDGAVVAALSPAGLHDLRLVGHSDPDLMVRNLAFTLRAMPSRSGRIVIGGAFGARAREPLARALGGLTIEELPAECPLEGIDDPAWREATPAIGLLHAATGSVSVPVIDFGQTTSAWSGPLRDGIQPLVPWAVAAAALALTAGLIDYARLSGHVGELDRRAAAIFREAVPGDRSDKARRLKMEMRLRELQGIAEGSGTATGSASPLAVLSAVSGAVPDDVAVELDTLQHAPPTVRMTGKGESFEAVTRLEEALSASGRFESVAVKDVHAAVNGAGVDFQVELRLLGESRS